MSDSSRIKILFDRLQLLVIEEMSAVQHGAASSVHQIELEASVGVLLTSGERLAWA